MGGPERDSGQNVEKKRSHSPVSEKKEPERIKRVRLRFLDARKEGVTIRKKKTEGRAVLQIRHQKARTPGVLRRETGMERGSEKRNRRVRFKEGPRGDGEEG